MVKKKDNSAHPALDLVDSLITHWVLDGFKVALWMVVADFQLLKYASKED